MALRRSWDKADNRYWSTRVATWYRRRNRYDARTDKRSPAVQAFGRYMWRR